MRILAFNDFHGALEPAENPARGPGAAAFAAEIAERRTPNTIVVSAGDLIGGSPMISGLFHDEPTIEVMNAIGLDYAGVGNHEFDEGAVELYRMQQGGCHPVDDCASATPFPGADFKFLAANVTTTATGALLFPAYDILDVGGAKIAFVGMTLEQTPAVTLASAVTDLTFADEVETMNALVPEIRAAGASIIILMLHQGGGNQGTANMCEGVGGEIVDITNGLDDAVAWIASGHTHDTYNCEFAGKLLTSAGDKGSTLTVVDLEIDVATQTLRSATAENVAVDTNRPTDPAVAAIVASYAELVAPLRDRVVASVTEDIIGSSPSGELAMGDVVADAMLEATSSRGAQVALMNPGGIRAGLRFALSAPETADGQVRYGEAFAVQPFSNEVLMVTITGADLVAALDYWIPVGNLQVAGLTYTFHPGSQGARVTAADVTVGGVPLITTQSYRVTVNSIVASPVSTPSMANATDPVGVGVDLDLLVPYLTANSPLSRPIANRISTP